MKQSSPIFSIVIPAYQRPKMLAKALESVLLQSVESWELIVVDDGSEISLQATLSADYPDPRIHWLRQKNRGPGAARKLGAGHASGSYICLLDDDDYFLPNHLETVLDHLEEEGFPETIVRTPLAGLYTDGKPVVYPDYRNDLDALLQYWRAPCGITSLVFPRVVFERCPIDPAPRIIEDFAWLSRVLIHYPLLQLSGPATVIYVQHERNRTLVQDGFEWAEARIAVIRAAYAAPEVADRVPQPTYRKMLAHQWWHAARQAALGKQHGLAGRLAKKGAAHLTADGIKEFCYTVWILVRARLNSFK